LRSAGEQVGRLPVEGDGAVDQHGCAADRPTEPMDEVLAVLRDARASGLSDDDLRFAGGLLSGRSTSQLAGDFGICERSVRNRRALVASRLRAVTLAADAA
jgi:FixJ family two-component response regulator